MNTYTSYIIPTSKRALMLYFFSENTLNFCAKTRLSVARASKLTFQNLCNILGKIVSLNCHFKASTPRTLKYPFRQNTRCTFLFYSSPLCKPKAFFNIIIIIKGRAVVLIVILRVFPLKTWIASIIAHLP